MLVFAREVFVCTCSTDVPPADGRAIGLELVRGTESDLARLGADHHGADDVADMRARLARGDYWLIGQQAGKIVTYTWLTRGERASYPSLPGCEIRLRPDTGYGYDAWTPPELRGQGLRRVAFLEELNILRRTWGLAWEASFFVKHQLEGATRSLAQVGIQVVPLWRVWLKPDRTLGAEKLADDAGAAVPTFAAATSDEG